VVLTVTPASVATWLAGQLHGGVTVVRLYEPAGDLGPASDVVERHSQWLDAAGPRGLYVQVLNEPDLEYPSLSPEAFARWWTLAASLIRTRWPQLRVGFPAPSIAASDDYLSRVAATGALERADFIGERGYWQDASDATSGRLGYRWVRSIDYKRPVIVTEFGCSSAGTPKVDLTPDPFPARDGEKETREPSKARQYLDYCASLPRFVVPAGAFIGAGGDPRWNSPEAGRLWIDDAMAAAIGVGEGERMLDANLVARVLQYAGPIVAAATALGVQASAVAGLIAVESGGWARATSPDNGPGLGRAMGLMQVLETHFSAGQDPYDPETNLAIGTAILRAKLDAYGGRLESGLAAYFGAVDAAGNPTDATDLTGTSGKRYVAEVLGAAESFKQLDRPGEIADPDFAQYAPKTGTWREVAVNLKGIADDALATGRKIVADVAANWGNR
jgi:soluble lytic murein transglycosylase-like protein